MKLELTHEEAQTILDALNDADEHPNATHFTARANARTRLEYLLTASLPTVLNKGPRPHGGD